MKCQIYIRFNGELGELNHQSQSGGWPFGIDPFSSAGPLYAKKFFFLILYSNTCGGKTKCMVHMSLNLSAEIVKFMTFWLLFFFKRWKEWYVVPEVAYLDTYIFAIALQNPKKHHVYANKQLIWTWKNIKDKAFYTCIK